MFPYSYLFGLAFFTCVFLYGQNSEKGKFSSEVFFDYYYNVQRDTNATFITNAVMDDPKDLNGFRFRRIFLSYDYSISSKTNVRFRIEADEKSNTSNGNIGVFMKDAYIEQDSIWSNHKIRIGIQPSPMFETAEKIWGHRYLEKTIMDQRGITCSRDMGISFIGKLHQKIKYHLLIGNNSINKPENDRFKSLYGSISYNLSKKVISSISYAYYFMAKKKDFYSSNYPNEMLNSDKEIISVFLGYQNIKKISTGLECFYMKWLHNFNTGFSMTDLETVGISWFLWFNLSKKIAMSYRIDMYEPNLHKLSTHDRRIWSMISLDYQIMEKLVISPNMQIEYYEPSNIGKKYKMGETARVTLFWKL